MWVLLEIYCSLQWKNFANRSRIDKVIAMVRVAPFLTHGVYGVTATNLLSNTKRQSALLLPFLQISFRSFRHLCKSTNIRHIVSGSLWVVRLGPVPLLSLKPRLHNTTCCQTGCQTSLTTGWTNSGCSFNTVVNNRLDVRLHDTDGCHNGCTTGCIV